jgi:Uma2 family endonuclease
LRYLREERPEHFMESTSQAQQRKIFVASFDLVMAANPHVHAYNELLVQWRRNGTGVIRKIVPDNMVVVSKEAPDPNGSYNLSLQPAPPFWVLEYVSKSNQRKDYEDSFAVYEQELEVPYYLLFYPETQDLSLYRHNGRYYVSVLPDEQQRYPIREIEVELGLLDGWVRFWFRGAASIPVASSPQHAGGP